MKLAIRWRRHIEHIAIAGLALRHEGTDENAPCRYDEDIPKGTVRMPLRAWGLHGMLRRQMEIASWNPVVPLGLFLSFELFRII